MKRLMRHLDLVLALALVLVFAAWPQLDLELARHFYHPGIGFGGDHIAWVRLVYGVFAHAWILALLWLFLLVGGYLPWFAVHLAPRRRLIVYLLLVLLTGPGLLVHTVFKDHWGRARPIHLLEFGGDERYTPPLQPSDQCHRNCSFVSGHAAVGFYLMAGYWITRRRRWLAAGIGLGLLLGYVRMLMGGHFLSDILFAGMLVHFCCRGLAWCFRLPGAGRGVKKPA